MHMKYDAFISITKRQVVVSYIPSETSLLAQSYIIYNNYKHLAILASGV